MARRHSGPLGLCLALSLWIAAPSAHAVEVVGRTEATFVWQPATGPVLGYLVYVARDGAAFPPRPELFVVEPRATVRGSVGEEIVVGVVAFSASGGLGPLSRESPPVRFVAQPSSPSVEVSPGTVFANGVAGGVAATLELRVLNDGGGRLDFTVTAATPWTRATPSTGSSTVSEVPVTVSFDTTGLAAGLHLSRLTVSAPGAKAVDVPVILSLAPPPPTLALTPQRISLATIAGFGLDDVLLTLTASMPGVDFFLGADQQWIRPRIEEGSAGPSPLVAGLGVDTAALARGKHWGHVYVIPSDPRVAIVDVDVTVTVVDPFAAAPVGPDLDGDGRADLVWRNDASGEVEIWWMDGTTWREKARLAAPVPAPAWRVIALADSDGDRRAEILWQDVRTGRVLAWRFTGTALTGTEVLIPSSDPRWKVVGASDFDGDARADLLWHRPDTGGVLVTTRQSAFVPETAGAGVESVLGSGDFDLTGTADFVWRDDEGTYRMWLSRDDPRGLPVGLDVPDGAGWSLSGIGDLDGDGGSDLLWRNEFLRETRLGRLENPFVADFLPLPPLRWPGWSPGPPGDFDGDGEWDLFWRNAGSGQAMVWLMEGTTLRAAGVPASPPPAGWSLQPAPR